MSMFFDLKLYLAKVLHKVESQVVDLVATTKIYFSQKVTVNYSFISNQ